MLSQKNISPRQLSAFTALALSLPIAIGFYAFEQNIVYAIVAFALIFGGSYLLISFTLERFIYRKVKLIYKFISQTKATRKEEMYYKYVLPPKGIEEVSADVEAWAEESKMEIEVLRQNEQFRKEFLQNLSHEFKTPIFAIQGYVETLLEGAMTDEGTKQKFLQNTARNVERLINLLQDLDEISKLERGELAIYKQNFVIQDLVREVFETLSYKAKSLNIHLSIKKGCEAPLTVFADKEKIRQVFINLIDNAIKYGRSDGNIVASMYRTDGKRILVELSDDGIGIAEKHLPRIFERFYRTDEGRSRDITGSGLGLAICKHIIEAHGQSIHVRSTEGVGTTVGFTLETRRD